MTPWACANATASQMRSKTRRRPGATRQIAGVLVEPAPAHELHRVEHPPVGQRAEVVHGHEAGVLEAGQHLRFRAQARFPARPRVGAVHHLERDLAAELAIEGAPDRAHAAASDAAAQLVFGAREVGRVHDLGQARERRVREAHGVTTPRRSRASARNSSSLAVSARSASSTSRRSSRRMAERWFVTCVTGSPSSRPSAS